VHSGSKRITVFYLTLGKNKLRVIENGAENISTQKVSEEHVASIFRVEEYVKHETSVKQVASRASRWFPAWRIFRS
jgi:hypothetical protein